MKPGFRLYGNTASLPKPRDQLMALRRRCRAGSALSRSAFWGSAPTIVRSRSSACLGELAIFVSALDRSATREAVRGRADDAGDVDSDLLPADLQRRSLERRSH